MSFPLPEISWSRRGRVLTGLALSLALLPVPAAGASDAVTAALPSIVTVEAGNHRATGFAFADPHRIITAARAVRGASTATLTLVDGAVASADVLGGGAARGIAVLRSAREVPPLERSSLRPRSDTPVFALTASLAVGPAIAHGHVERGAAGGPGQIIRTDISADAEDLGAPLLDSDGRLLGVTINGRGEAAPSGDVASADRRFGLGDLLDEDGSLGPAPFIATLALLLIGGGAIALRRTRRRRDSHIGRALDSAGPAPVGLLSLSPNTDEPVVLLRRAPTTED